MLYEIKTETVRGERKMGPFIIRLFGLPKHLSELMIRIQDLTKYETSLEIVKY